MHGVIIYLWGRVGGSDSAAKRELNGYQEREG